MSIQITGTCYIQHVHISKKKKHVAFETQTYPNKPTQKHMLQTFPAYAVHSATLFQESAFWTPEPVASTQSARQRGGTHIEPTGDEEDYVFV
jgi:hypothetical protein